MNQYLTNKISQAIQERLEKADGKPITITMKSTGLPIVLAQTESGITASGPESALRFSGKDITETAGKIADYKRIHKRWLHDKENCRELFEQLCCDRKVQADPEHAWEDFCYYAEKHEQVFGFRPAYLEYGVPEKA